MKFFSTTWTLFSGGTTPNDHIYLSECPSENTQFSLDDECLLRVSTRGCEINSPPSSASSMFISNKKQQKNGGGHLANGKPSSKGEGGGGKMGGHNRERSNSSTLRQDSLLTDEIELDGNDSGSDENDLLPTIPSGHGFLPTGGSSSSKRSRITQLLIWCCFPRRNFMH